MNRSTILAPAAAAAVVLGLSAPSPATADQSAHVAGPLTSYDAILAPAGATAGVHAVEAGDGSAKTIVTLQVKGLVPDREYGAHAHNLPCGALGSAAGAHYQYVVDPATGGDPKKASTDPAYANPENEIWLDFTTNDAGNGQAKAVVGWQMPDNRRAASVVIHVRHTDHTGAAGARAACISVPF